MMERSAFPQQGMSVGAELLDRQFGMTIREVMFLQVLAAIVANPALTPDDAALGSATARADALVLSAAQLLDADPIAVARQAEIDRLKPIGGGPGGGRHVP
jgi:hypothetical protein